jgi:glycosyltransferase involved in cell wall biosynthesis
MSCEVPVIGSDSGSIPELLGSAGQVFPEGCINSLIACIQDLMADPEKRCEMGKQGRTRVHGFYSLNVMYDNFLAMYQRLNHHINVPDIAR